MLMTTKQRQGISLMNPFCLGPIRRPQVCQSSTKIDRRHRSPLLDQAKCVTRLGKGSSIVSLIHRALVLVPRCRIRGLELPLWIAEGKSSNWREARNLLEGLKEASREHSTDNTTTEAAFWKGTSQSKALSKIVLQILQMVLRDD